MYIDSACLVPTECHRCASSHEALQSVCKWTWGSDKWTWHGVVSSYLSGEGWAGLLYVHQAGNTCTTHRMIHNHRMAKWKRRLDGGTPKWTSWSVVLCRFAIHELTFWQTPVFVCINGVAHLRCAVSWRGMTPPPQKCIFAPNSLLQWLL